jgi:hypothetical protein
MSQLESGLQPIEELYDPNSEQYSTNPTPTACAETVVFRLSQSPRSIRSA